MDYKRWIKQYFNKSSDWAIITGATSGIGLEYYKLIAAERCNCIIISNETRELEKVSQEMESKYGTKHIAINCDLSIPAQIFDLRNQLPHSNVKILINNAGFGMKGDFVDTPVESLTEILNVNSLTPALMMHEIIPQMRAQRCGLIINVATVNVASPIPYNSLYTATKFFSYALSLSVGYENARYGILFQTMLPGTTATPFHDKQNAIPAKSSLTMTPDKVAKGSLCNLNSMIYIPNRIDRLFFPVMSRLPIFFRMRLANFILKKRLGVG